MIQKKSISIKGHNTSITLEEEFWEVLQEIKSKQNISLSALVGSIDDARVKDGKPSNLSSAIRVFILNYYKGKLSS